MHCIYTFVFVSMNCIFVFVYICIVHLYNFFDVIGFIRQSSAACSIVWSMPDAIQPRSPRQQQFSVVISSVWNLNSSIFQPSHWDKICTFKCWLNLHKTFPAQELNLIFDWILLKWRKRKNCRHCGRYVVQSHATVAGFILLIIILFLSLKSNPNATSSS